MMAVIMIDGRAPPAMPLPARTLAKKGASFDIGWKSLSPLKWRAKSLSVNRVN
jgi:hypothetical protein